MVKFRKEYAAICLYFILLAVVVFRCGLGPEQVFSGSDANIGLLMAAKSRMPQSFSGAFSSAPVLGGTSSTSFSFANIGQLLLSPTLYSDTWYAVYLIISSLALVGYLRLWNIRWACAAFGSLSAFWLGSITMAAAGHMTKFGVMAFFALSLFLLEKSLRSNKCTRIGYSLLTGACVGFMLLEQQDVGLLAGLFLGTYAVARLIIVSGRKWQGWIGVLMPIAVVALALSTATALKAYKRGVVETGLQEDPKRQWEFITQWSMVPRELPDLVAPGYSGWSSGNPDGPYWGDCGQSAEWKTTGRGYRNFKLDNFYLGVLPVFLSLIGFFAAFRAMRSKDERGIIFFLWGGLGVVALVLAFGKFSPLYKLFYRLPLVGNIRAPVKFMHNLQVIVGIMAAYGLNVLVGIEEGKSKSSGKWILGIVAAATLLMFAFAVSAGMPEFETRFSEWGQYASVISKNISRAWIHAGVMGILLCAALYFLIDKRMRRGSRFVPLLLVAAVSWDAAILVGKYFRSDDISELKAGNTVLNYLKQNQGNERVFCFSQQGPYNLWISQDFLYHGINGFNFGQMPRMPGDYKAFFKAVGGNWRRLVRLTSCRHGLAPAATYAQMARDENLSKVVQPVMCFRFSMRNGRVSAEPLMAVADPNDQVLLEFGDSLPRFSLFPNWDQVPDEEACGRLTAPDFMPDEVLLLSDTTPISRNPTGSGRYLPVSVEKMDNTSVHLKVASPNGGIVLFTQRYQPGWSARVDGEPAALLKCNFLNMGVYAPPGEHEVVFECPRNSGPPGFQSVVLALSVSTAGFLLVCGRNGKDRD